MAGNHSRNKGLNYERQIAKRLKKYFPDAKRQLEYQQGFGVDLQNTGNLAIQCKRGKKYASITKIFEIPKSEKIKLLITRGDNLADMVVISLKDFEKIIDDVGNVYE